MKFVRFLLVLKFVYTRHVFWRSYVKISEETYSHRRILWSWMKAWQDAAVYRPRGGPPSRRHSVSIFKTDYSSTRARTRNNWLPRVLARTTFRHWLREAWFSYFGDKRLEIMSSPLQAILRVAASCQSTREFEQPWYATKLSRDFKNIHILGVIVARNPTTLRASPWWRRFSMISIGRFHARSRPSTRLFGSADVTARRPNVVVVWLLLC